MKAKELQDLLDFISKSGLDEVNIETEGYKIKVKKNSVPKTQIIESGHATVPVPAQIPPTSAAAPVVEATSSNNGNGSENGKSDDNSELIAIKSPMIGTFYRSSNPDSDSFVNIGDQVTNGQTVCIVEAMKLFNEIESEISGTVVKVLVDNASPVEYDQPLFLVDPA